MCVCVFICLPLYMHAPCEEKKKNGEQQFFSFEFDSAPSAPGCNRTNTLFKKSGRGSDLTYKSERYEKVGGRKREKRAACALYV